ncbi:unnamed protein product, partial [Rotaria sordida]
TLYDLVHVLYTHNERDTIAGSILLRVIIPPNAQARVMFETSFVGGQCATLIESNKVLMTVYIGSDQYGFEAL